MAIMAIKGPLNVFGQSATPPNMTQGMALDYNGERSSSMFDQGVGIADPRYFDSYMPGNVVVTGANTLSQQGTKGSYGWFGNDEIVIVDAVPSTLTTTAIAAAQVPVAGTAMTLVSSTAAGITVGVVITRADTGVADTVLAIDGAMGAVGYGFNGGNYLWDPTKALARAVAIQSAGNDSGATFTVRGYDVYGFPMTETITGGNIATANGKKAFKYIKSITPAGTLSGANANAGQSDIYGFMLRSDLFQYLQIYMPDTTLISATTGYVAAVTTNPATAVTGDVRGTYAVQTASNNARRLIIIARLVPAAIGTQAGLTGVDQFANF